MFELTLLLPRTITMPASTFDASGPAVPAALAESVPCLGATPTVVSFWTWWTSLSRRSDRSLAAATRPEASALIRCNTVATPCIIAVELPPQFVVRLLEVQRRLPTRSRNAPPTRCRWVIVNSPSGLWRSTSSLQDSARGWLLTCGAVCPRCELADVVGTQARVGVHREIEPRRHFSLLSHG